MKINFAMYATGLTGGVRTFFEISDRLVERGHTVTLTSLGVPRYASWFNPKAKVVHFDHFALLRKIAQELLNKIGKGESATALAILDRQVKVLARALPECDINVATYCFTAFSVLQSRRGVPFYHMQHYEPLFAKNPVWKKRIEETYLLPLNKIANSTWLKNKIEVELGIKNIPIVNHAIDHRIFFPRGKKTSGGKFKIIALGRFSAWKGIFDLFETMKLVLERTDQVEFYLYGSKKLPDVFGHVPHHFIFNPTDSELAELYSESDLVVCPSWYESFPLPPLEGMACGIPVITTPYGTEDYAFDEKNALVVPPKDPKLMAEAIFRLMEDRSLRDKIVSEGIKTAGQFTWKKTTDKVEALFSAALKNK